jgi:hypothetical protein
LLQHILKFSVAFVICDNILNTSTNTRYTMSRDKTKKEEFKASAVSLQPEVSDPWYKIPQ